MGWSTPLFLIDSESSPSFFSSKYVLACVLLSEIFPTSMSTTLNSLTSVFSISPFYAKTVLDFSEYSKARIEFEELSSELLEKVDL